MEFRSREDASREVQRRSAMLLTGLPPPYGGLSAHSERLCAMLECGGGNGFLPDRLEGSPPRLRALYRWLYEGASFAIAKNERILAAFESLGLGSRAQVIGTFLEPTRGLCGRPLSAELEHYLAVQPVCVISAGFRFEPLYHLDEAVRAVAYVRKAAPQRGIEGHVGLIVLASHVEDPVGKSSFDVAVAETGLAGDVMTLRDIDNALDVVARASVLVRATDVDGDANTVKEAMMLGVPVLATDLPGRPPGIDLIRREELGSLGPRLLDTIVHRNPARIEANRKFLREDIANNTAAILAVYERVSGR